jgi:hypothetical protein
MTIGIIFSLVGGLLFAIGFFVWLGVRRFLESSLEAEGTVVAMNRSYKGGYAPVFEYRAGGQPIQVAENIYTSPPQYSVGDKVPVRYEPENPEGARIAGPFNLYFVPGLLAGMGLIFGIVGVAMLIAGIVDGIP